MEIPLYLAMTAAEFTLSRQLPEKIAWMACHFSPYGTGLTNLPKELPPNSLLILNDRTPVCGHDPDLICSTLSECCQKLHCTGILLDFQRPGCDQLNKIIDTLLTLPFPVAVSDIYAQDFACPVFLSAPPPHKPVKDHIAPWQGREIWLEASMSHTQITVNGQGSTVTASPSIPLCDGFSDLKLHCHYSLSLSDEAAVFTLSRTRQDISELLQEGHSLGVTQAIGLYQELGK